MLTVTRSFMLTLTAPLVIKPSKNSRSKNHISTLNRTWLRSAKASGGRSMSAYNFETLLRSRILINVFLLRDIQGVALFIQYYPLFNVRCTQNNTKQQYRADNLNLSASTWLALSQVFPGLQGDPSTCRRRGRYSDGEACLKRLYLLRPKS